MREKSMSKIKTVLLKGIKMKKTNAVGNFKEFHNKSIALTAMLILSVLVFSTTLWDHTNDGIKFEHISIEHGLSQGTISCIIQDNRGFMWFGTENGLNRYDGHEFKPYTSDSNNLDTLSHNLVISIFKEQSGILWIGTQGGGINKFDPKTEKFTNHRNNQNFGLFKKMNIRDIHEDKQGILWIGTDEGLYKSDQEKKILLCHYCKNKDGEFINKINTIYEDNKEKIWVGADDGLYEDKYNSGNGYFKHYPIELGYDFNIEVNAIYEDQPGELWIGTIIGLYKFDRKTGKFSPFKEEVLKNKQISVIYKDKKNTIWIGSQGDGLYQLDPGKNSITGYRNIPDDFTSLSNNNVLDIHQDKLGLIWIGTFGGGINKLDPGGKKFTLYKNIPGDPDSLINNEVRGICQDKEGGIWVSTRGGGISKFDLVNEKFKAYLIEEDISKDPRRNEVNIIKSDHFGNIWVGTFQSGLYKFVPGNGTFHHHKSKSIKKEDHIISIYVDEENYLWIGIQDKGLIKLDKDEERKELHCYQSDPKESNSLSNNNVYAICEDHSGILWIGTGGGGLNKFDKEKDQFFHYLPKQDKPKWLSHNFITAIYQESSKILWIGTLGGGLNKFEKEQKTFTVYKTEQGLPNNVIYDILGDNKGNLWLTTNRGLAKFNPKTGKSRNFTINDGLQGCEFNLGAAYYSKKTGMMFLGGFNGFNVFEPAKISDTWAPPDIVITALKILNKSVPLNKYISGNKALTLSYKDNFVSFGFAALNFSDPENNQYAYKLKPINKDWIQLGNKHDVDFSGLGPGKYIFRVKGADSHGVWNENGTSIKITITPPFWATWWFYTLISLALIIGVFTVIKLRTRRIENQKRILEELVGERTDEINQQKDELKKANTLLKQEINVRKQTEASLKESEERYRTLIETSPDAIALSEIDIEHGKIIMANYQAANLLGYGSVDEMYANVKTILEIFSFNDRDKARKNARMILKTGLNKNTEYNIQTKDGAAVPVEISTSLIRDVDGTPKYFLTITRDIRDRKEAEKQEKIHQEKLMHADKMISLGNLVSDVAHELNNPAGTLKMNSEIFNGVWKDIVPVLDKYYKDKKDFSLSGIPYQDAKKRLEDLIIGFMEGSQRIEKIINDLRDFSRPGDPANKEPTDIHKVIESSVNLTNNLIKKATKRFSLKFAESLSFIEGNFHKLEQVFINLIQNACHALSDNNKGISILTSITNEKNHITITVKDEGVGIDEKELSFITDRFYTTKKDEGGIGLGLYISMKIIQDHKGNMEFQSEKGKGTTVTVTLPVNEC